GAGHDAAKSGDDASVQRAAAEVARGAARRGEKRGGRVMSYRVFYGDAAAMASRARHLDERVRSEWFSTEHEALRRAGELLAEDASTVVAICDRAGNLLSGVRLQLRLGYTCE